MELQLDCEIPVSRLYNSEELGMIVPYLRIFFFLSFLALLLSGSVHWYDERKKFFGCGKKYGVEHQLISKGKLLFLGLSR